MAIKALIPQYQRYPNIGEKIKVKEIEYQCTAFGQDERGVTRIEFTPTEIKDIETKEYTDHLNEVEFKKPIPPNYIFDESYCEEEEENESDS